MSRYFREFELNLNKMSYNKSDTQHILQLNFAYTISCFDINFKSDLGSLLKSVNIRHDIVHRCGKSKKNDEHHITFERLAKLKEEIISFIKDIDMQLESNFTLIRA